MSYWITAFKVVAIVVVVLITIQVVMAAIAILTYAIALAVILYVGWILYKWYKSEEDTDATS